MHSALCALIPALISQYVQSILSSVGKLIKEMGRLTLFSIICFTGLTRAKSGVDAVT